MEFKTNNKNLIYLDWKNKEHVNAVCKLHAVLLPESILSKMGNLFLSKFYYSKLIKEKLIEVYLYQLNGEFVGFISCTNEPYTFMKSGQKKYLFLILSLMGISVLLKPGRLSLILSMGKDLSKYETTLNDFQNEFGDKMGYLVSFGVLMNNNVLESYRQNIDNIQEVGISSVLLNFTADHFKFNNKSHYYLMTLKVNNKAIKLYKKHLGVFIDSDENNESYVVKYDL